MANVNLVDSSDIVVSQNGNNIQLLNAYSTDSYSSNGISIRFEKVGRVVTCTFEGTTSSNLTTNVDYSISFDSKYSPHTVSRNNCIFNENGVIIYINVPTNGTVLSYRVKSNVSSPAYPRFSFTYISAN